MRRSGFEPHAIEGPLPPALSARVHDQGWERPRHPEDVQEAFEVWSEAMPGSVLPGGGHSVCLGALHVFTCGACDRIRTIAEI